MPCAWLCRLAITANTLAPSALSVGSPAVLIAAVAATPVGLASTGCCACRIGPTAIASPALSITSSALDRLGPAAPVRLIPGQNLLRDCTANQTLDIPQ
jgi:hypothetical protein